MKFYYYENLPDETKFFINRVGDGDYPMDFVMANLGELKQCIKRKTEGRSSSSTASFGKIKPYEIRRFYSGTETIS